MTNEEMAVKLQQVDDRSKSNCKRLDEAEEKLKDNAEMLASIARIDQHQKDMANTLNEVKDDVKSITGKAGRRWDSIVDKVLLGIIAALVAYALRQIGIS